MKPAGALGASLALCALLVVTTTALAPGGSAPRPAADIADAEAEVQRFPHARHVSRAWLQGEVARDCRTCHVWGEGATDAAERCDGCHYDRRTDGAATLAVTGRAGAIPRALPMFRHEDHLPDGMTCATCHVDPAAPKVAVPDDVWMPSGTGWCARCHDPAATDPDPVWNARAAAADVQRAFKAALDAAPQMAAASGARFRHEDHLSGGADGSWDERVCTACHAGMAGAGPEIGEHLFDPAACGSCHVGQDDRAPQTLVEAVRPAPASAAAGTFRHDDHLGAAAVARSPRLAELGCFACHASRPEAATEDDRFPLQVGVTAFSSCVGCHLESGMTGPLATALPDHGEVDSCAGCHAVGTDARDMKTNRPRREVERRRGGRFTMTATAHPHVTGPAIDASCSRCHVAEREVLASRIASLPFAHDPHLPDGDHAAGACGACHLPAAADGTMTSRAVEGDRLHHTDACDACHRNPAPATFVASGAVVTTETVPAFSHHDHLRDPLPGRERLVCTDCHVAASTPSPGDEWHESADVVACTACHDHGANADVTAGKGPDYVAGCALCHEQGVPADGEIFALDRRRVSGFEGVQAHPLPEDRSCAACHVRLEREFLAQAATAALGSVRGERAGYASGALFHDFADAGRGTPSAQCLDCHWHQAGASKFRQQRDMSRLASEAKIRAAFGAGLGPLPGSTR